MRRQIKGQIQGQIQVRIQIVFKPLNGDVLKFKLNVNSNEYESKNASGGACARGVKRPRVGVLTHCVFAFVFV